MHWWFRHMSAMLGACTAATTAFLVVNAPQAGFSRASLIAWFTPAVVGDDPRPRSGRVITGGASTPSIPNGSPWKLEFEIGS